MNELAPRDNYDGYLEYVEENFSQEQYEGNIAALRAMLWEMDIPESMRIRFGVDNRRPGSRRLGDAEKRMFQAFYFEEAMAMDHVHRASSLEGDLQSGKFRLSIQERMAKLLGLDDKVVHHEVSQANPYQQVMDGIIVEPPEVVDGNFITIPQLEQDDDDDQPNE